MKKFVCIAVFLMCAFSLTRSLAITQEIRYSAEEASEVYIVWGINNWQLPENKNLPAGSYIKDNLVYTPMTLNDLKQFSTNIDAKPGTIIDYVFWIRKGLYDKQADVWDKNEPHQKDYHTYVTDNTVTLIESKIKIMPKEPLSILDFAYLFLFVSFLLFFALYIVHKFWFKFTLEKQPQLIILCSAFSLLFCLFLIRPSVMGISWELYTNPTTYGTQALWAAFYDFIYISILTLVFLLLLVVLEKHPRLQKFVCYFFVGLCCISLVIGLFNIRIVDMLGKPFNYQWLYYSNFLKGADAQAAISANISSNYILRVTSVCISAFALGLIAFKGLGLLFRNPIRRKIIIGSILLTAIIYSITANKKLQAKQWNYDRLANPITAFIESVNPFAANPDLFTMPVLDSLVFKKEALNPNNPRPTNSQIKNIIVFVLESTPAEYIETYGSKYPVSPTIKKYESQSITFENIYAHAPATNMSMVSLLNSVYPWLSFNSLTEEHPDLKFPSISTELKQRGYRTAFFNSADNRYQRANEFLSYRKFDMIRDCNEKNSCGNAQFEYTDEKKNFLNGKDDVCTAQELTDWIAEDTSRPFLGMMWTYQTHYPYFYKGQQVSYEPGDSVFNRYLNAMHYGDAVLGKLLEYLEQKHLSESTLVVVVGDHGEAFGRHNQTTHGREIYEENLHVPCILINPMFKQERRSQIGGMIDIAPTIMHSLGFESPEQWHGQSLFAKTDRSRTYFFAPWSDYLFGYREGDYKYIYNATKNETEVYNLKEDFFEGHNLVNTTNEIETIHQRMAAWAQYVNTETAKILKQ